MSGIRVTFIDTNRYPRDNPISSHVAPCGVDAALLTVNCLFNIPQKPRKRSSSWFTAFFVPRKNERAEKKEERWLLGSFKDQPRPVEAVQESVAIPPRFTCSSTRSSHRLGLLSMLILCSNCRFLKICKFLSRFELFDLIWDGLKRIKSLFDKSNHSSRGSMRICITRWIVWSCLRWFELWNYGFIAN